MSKKQKYLRPLSKAELSLQFLRDDQGTPRFIITSNPAKEGKPFCTGVDALIFAQNFVDDDLTDITEKEWLCVFFANVKQYLDKKKDEAKLNKVCIYANGMVACFNRKGHQMSELQGKWMEKQGDIFWARMNNPVKYYFGIFGGDMVELPEEAARNLKF